MTSHHVALKAGDKDTLCNAKGRTECSEGSRVVQGSQHPQLVERVVDVVLGGRVHEVKVQEVVHVQRLEQEHGVAQVGALDLRDGDLQHLVPEGLVRVQPPTHRVRCPAY